MQLAPVTGNEAIPWRFDTEEQEHLRSIFNSSLVRAYLQSLKYLALSNKTLPPESATLEDIKASNDYLAGQEYIIEALMTQPLYVTPQTTQSNKEHNNV